MRNILWRFKVYQRNQYVVQKDLRYLQDERYDFGAGKQQPARNKRIHHQELQEC